MNADRLLAHWELIADAPDAIARLRRFILDLAVRGKLVPQHASDEPASGLLKQIANERAERISRGEMRHGKLSANPIDFPFELPSGWVWLRLGETGSIFSGNSINDATREQLAKTQEGRPFIATKDIGYGLDRIGYENGLLVELSDKRFKVARINSVLICAEGGSAGKKIGLADREICFGNKLLANETFSVVTSKFALYACMSTFFFQQFSSKMKGIIGGISIANFLELPFPLPPLAEQHRIVAKVDELMRLCDRLEAARVGREGVRDRLAAASLARLNAPDPETFQADARFALDALPALTSRPDQIKALRQTILNLAVRGKLVSQDANDKPASELLVSLRAAGKKTRSGKLSPDDIRMRTASAPFDCPKGWVWTTVQNALDANREISYGIIKLGDEPKSGGVPTLRCSDVRPGYIDLSRVRKVQEAIEAEYARTRLSGGEVVINIRGTLGGVALVPNDFSGFNIAREVAVVPIAEGMLGQFMVYLMLSPYFWDHIQNNLRGIAYKGLNLGILRDLPIPLPPLAEQHRVVAKVDALMALCDRLEASLTTTAATRRHLLDALLAEALSPAEQRQMEAAE